MSPSVNVVPISLMFVPTAPKKEATGFFFSAIAPSVKIRARQKYLPGTECQNRFYAASLKMNQPA
jgi:hypothetical protein